MKFAIKRSTKSLILAAGILVTAFAAAVASATTSEATSATTSAANTASPFPAGVKMKLNYKDQEVTSMIEAFAKASQKTFVVDPGVRGRASVFAPTDVSLDEAFDLISTSLALNGYAIIEREGRYVVLASRNAQRSSIPTLTEITAVKPERYVTLLVTLKNVPVTEINKNLRVLPSKDGEMTPLVESNQLMITDYISNVDRIAKLLKLLDQPVAPNMAKIIKEGKTRDAADRAAWAAREKREAKVEPLTALPPKFAPKGN